MPKTKALTNFPSELELAATAIVAEDKRGCPGCHAWGCGYYGPERKPGYCPVFVRYDSDIAARKEELERTEAGKAALERAYREWIW